MKRMSARYCARTGSYAVPKRLTTGIGLSALSDIAEYLAARGIEYQRHDHPPVFTCEEEAQHVPESGAARTKNLFFRDRKGKRHLLLVTLCSKQVSIDAFSEISGADRLSFASPERMMKYLGV